jgi:hypothetical protein
MKNTLFCVLVIIFGVTCCKSKNKEIQPIGGFTGSLSMMIQDKNGIDRLNPAFSIAFRTFKVYYLLDGKRVLYNKPQMDAPNGYIIERSDTDRYYLKIFINGPNYDSKNKNNWITYLEYQDGITDTINASFDIKPGLITVEKAYYNQYWAWGAQSEPYNIFGTTK